MLRVRFFQLILIFLIMSSVSLSWGSSLWGDINGDEKIGLEEAVYALQVVSGVKTARVNATHKGTIDMDEIWTPEGNPHIITGDLTVAGPAPNGATLTIEPGTEIWIDQYASIKVGASQSPGTLTANGTEVSPILFTSNQTVKTRGWWENIRFADQAINCQMSYCTIEYGGYGLAELYEEKGNILVNKAQSVYISHCIITNSDGNGMSINTTSDYYESFLGSVTLSDNTFSDNEWYGIRLYTDNIRGLDASNKFTDNKLGGIYVEGSHADITVRHDATWHRFDEPYIVENIIIGTSDQPTLTIEAGVELRFVESAMLEVRSGSLVAEGSSDLPIKFTSKQNIQTKGWWEGVYFQKDAINCSLKYCTVEYGGSKIPDAGPWISGNVVVRTVNGVNIHNCDINNSEKYGLIIKSEYLENGANADITGTSFSNNGGDDIYVYTCRDDVGSYTGIPADSPSIDIYDCEQD